MIRALAVCLAAALVLLALLLAGCRAGQAQEELPVETPFPAREGLRIAVACTPFTWEDVMGMTREKLGKKRKIRLPQSLVIPAEPKPRRAKPQASASPEVEEALEQLRMEELMQQAEETDPQ